nr:hypothetical protein BaRGS_015187 [Batillaria attramentaria]
MGGGMNPMLMMSLLQMAMADPSAMSFPVVSMLARNPTVLQNPAMLYGLSGMLGVDTNKLIGPMFLANSGGMPGGGNAMGFMPLLPFMGGMGDAGLMTSLMLMGMPGLMGGGMGGGMGMGGLGGMGGMGALALGAAA